MNSRLRFLLGFFSLKTDFQRSNCKYSGSGDWIVNEFEAHIESKSGVLKGQVRLLSKISI